MGPQFGDQTSFLPQPQQPHHAGQKRRADDEGDTSGSGISTHFKKLRINHAPLHPLQPSHPRVHSHYPPLLASHNEPSAIPPAPAPTPVPQNDQATSPPPSMENSDFMPVDFSHPSRVFIHDLDAEIAAIEAEEPKPTTFFLPDLDRKISNIPSHLLRSGQADTGTDNMQLVLYRDPTSISVPVEEDAVRKAIIDARRRTRKRQAAELERAEALEGVIPDNWLPDRDEESSSVTNEVVRGPNHYYMEEDEDDADMMDIG